MSKISLFTWFPPLKKKLPHISIIEAPTPLEKLTRLGESLGHDQLWVKRDDATVKPYGGNKPRKLEFLLGDAKQRRASAVATTGGIGSNHSLATTIYAGKLGFPVHLILVPQPVTPHVRMSLRLFIHFGAHLHLCPEYEEVMQQVERLQRNIEGLYFIPAGGSNALGALGFVNAALELADQTTQRIMPEPQALFVPAGTCGTLAGLALGFKIARLNTKIYGVRVVDTSVTNADTVLELMDGSCKILRDLTQDIPRVKINQSNFEILEGYFGETYGQVTPEGIEAKEIMRKTEDIPLETTYTAKTVAAMKDYIDESLQKRPLLYWNTFAGPVLEKEAKTVGMDRIPEDFKQFFKD